MKLLQQIIYKGYVIGLMIFTVWYGTFMYSLIFGFEGKEEAAESFKELTGTEEADTRTEEEKMFARLLSEQEARSKTNLGFKVIDQPYIEGRFHHVGFAMQRDEASICVRCHGNVPHNKSKELRSFLNMHAFYLACETCHASRPADGQKYEFRWYSKSTGDIVPNPLALKDIEDAYTNQQSAMHVYPTYGNYGAKIAPGTIVNGKFKLLHDAKDLAFVTKYIQEREKLLPEKKSQMEQKIHEEVAEKPIECVRCHSERDQYFSFSQLGYPPTRERELTNTAVVGMIRKYKEFYIPSFLHPGGRQE